MNGRSKNKTRIKQTVVSGFYWTLKKLQWNQERRENFFLGSISFFCEREELLVYTI